MSGSAARQCSVALVLLDVLTDFDFPEGDILSAQATPLAHILPSLIQRARESEVSIIYANDNWGRCRCDQQRLLEHFLRPESRGREFVSAVLPTPQDYVVIKAKHSGFFGTSLELLLKDLGAQTLVLAGLAGNICVLFTAHEAYLRDYRLVVPSDGLASLTARDNDWALDHMRRVLRAQTPTSAEVDFAPLKYTLAAEIA